MANFRPGRGEILSDTASSSGTDRLSDVYHRLSGSFPPDYVPFWVDRMQSKCLDSMESEAVIRPVRLQFCR